MERTCGRHVQMEQTYGRHSCWSRQWLLAGYAGACLLAYWPCLLVMLVLGCWLCFLITLLLACLLVVLAGCACFLAGIGGAVKLRSSTSVCLFFFMSVSVFLVFLNNPPTPTQPTHHNLPYPIPHPPAHTPHHLYIFPHPPLTTHSRTPHSPHATTTCKFLSLQHVNL